LFVAAALGFVASSWGPRTTMQRKLIQMGLLTLFLAGLAGSAGILTGGIDLGADRMYEWAEHGAALAFIAFAGGAVLSARSLDSYDGWEAVPIGVALIVLVAGYLGDPQVVNDLLNDHHPWSGLAATAAGVVGYHSAAMKR
jgi:hypothetical protein